MILRFFAVVICIIASQYATAFPELVKHGYPNCMACHVSPTGGGVLTEYGRALSKELLSTWGFTDEERFMYALPTTEHVALGGDWRFLNVQDNSPTSGFRERSIHMQRDFEAALTAFKITVAGTAGIYEPKMDGKTEFLSRRHYLIYQATDKVSLRAGKFYPQFGLYIPDHNTTIRRGLQWDQNMESYNFEAAYQTDRWNFFATGVFGRPDDTKLKREREKGGTVTVAYNPSDKYKYGFSYYYGKTAEITHHYMGPFAIFGFSDKVFLLAQATAVRSFPYTSQKQHWGMVDYLRLDYEPWRGIHFFLTQEFTQLNFKSGITRADTFSLGTQIFPRPHFEFQLVWQKLYEQGFNKQPTDRLNFIAHFYP